jgi:hypothetical protein
VHVSEIAFVINETLYEIESGWLHGWSQLLVVGASELSIGPAVNRAARIMAIAHARRRPFRADAHPYWRSRGTGRGLFHLRV